jgi:hypothetical protein
MEMKRDELFHFIRWFNLIAGVFNLYLFSMGGGYHLLGLGFINTAVWAFTRKVKFR